MRDKSTGSSEKLSSLPTAYCLPAYCLLSPGAARDAPISRHEHLAKRLHFGSGKLGNGHAAKTGQAFFRAVEVGQDQGVGTDNRLVVGKFRTGLLDGRKRLIGPLPVAVGGCKADEAAHAV